MKVFTEEKAEKFLSSCAPVAKSVLAKNLSAAIAASKKLKFPLMLKMISPQALHKTEVSGVRSARDESELKKEYSDIVKTAAARKIKLDGVLVQEFVKGEEIMIGLKKDPTFGHVIVLGIGGKYVEVIKDVTFRSCPIDIKEAGKMINELRYKKILFGVRGSKPANIKLLEKTLVAVSNLPARHKDIEELDINPFIINDKEGKIADARIVFS